MTIVKATIRGSRIWVTEKDGSRYCLIDTPRRIKVKPRDIIGLTSIEALRLIKKK